MSKPKIKLFQTKIRFLGFEIHLGLIKPIQMSIEFASNFPDQITDKTQLQRFLGCLNYVSNFLQNIRLISKPLFERLKKNPKPGTEEHTKTVQKNQIPCQVNSVFIADKH